MPPTLINSGITGELSAQVVAELATTADYVDDSDPWPDQNANLLPCTTPAKSSLSPDQLSQL